MMTRKVVDRERLAAFADGELTPEEAAEVVMHLADHPEDQAFVMHLADHPEDQAFVDEVMAANAALARAFAGPLGEPVPEPIRATILGPQEAAPGTRILTFPRKTWPRKVLAGLALAACVAGLGLVLARNPAAMVFEPGPLAAGSALHQAISAQASGQTLAVAGGELTILASLPVEGGHCREAEWIDRSQKTLTLALICDQGTGWQVQVALMEPLPEAVTGFVPAGGIETGALDLWLDRMGAGMALGPEEEAQAIAGGWAAP